ncbi:MAG: OadG family protein [Mogibacterium sp.]|nr:OadG family protein [Mogibacterium sp.]
MSLGQIFLTALLYTLIGMGTVFAVLIFISICIWLLGKAFAPKKPAVQAVAAAAAEPEEPEGIRPEVVAAILAAIHQQLKDEEGVPEEGYIVRNVRRATWRHTS